MTVSAPLVTIAIISYNNEAYIRDCIVSCLSQTYPNIEVVIADDASTDLSPHIIREYVERYPQKVRAEFSDINAGVAANFNRAVKASKGTWFKIIACDDVLMPNCIELYMSEIAKHNIEAGILFGRMRSFGDMTVTEEISFVPTFFNLTDAQRLESLALMNTLPAPTAFFRLDTLKALGMASERYAFLEDYPLWINAVKASVFLHCIDAVTVKYRVHESLSNSKQRIGHLGYYQSVLKFSREVLWPIRRGWGCLKNFEDWIELNRVIISIRWFSNQKTLSYRAIEFICKPLKLYSIQLKIRKLLDAKVKPFISQ